ncbi:MAG: hypothetical protein ACE5OZ_08330 [Candidatus Heimdallarchaeota archaeon]
MEVKGKAKSEGRDVVVVTQAGEEYYFPEANRYQEIISGDDVYINVNPVKHPNPRLDLFWVSLSRVKGGVEIDGYVFQPHSGKRRDDLWKEIQRAKMRGWSPEGRF